VGIAVILGIMVIILGALYDRLLGESKMTRMLGGGTDVQLSGIEGEGGTWCTDSRALRYFEQAARTASTDNPRIGYSYKVTFHFQGGGTFRVWVSAWPDGMSVSMPDSADEESFPTHSFTFPGTLPRELGPVVRPPILDRGERGEGRDNERK
jgi:hypothetical protein